MTLKNTLLTLMLSGMVVSCEHGATMGYQKSTHSSQPAVAQNNNSQMSFLKNYNHLYKNIDGAWFSFGDEKLIRKALFELKNVPIAQKIIAELPENINIGSTHFLREDLSGAYDNSSQTVNVLSDAISSTPSQKKDKLTVPEILFHELYHAYQDGKGLILSDKPSMDEVLISQRLIEAEAHAWTNVLQETRKISSNGTYSASPEDIKNFMKKNIIADKEKEMIKMGLEKMSPRYKTLFKETDPTYCFQQCLIACRGHVQKASHLMATKRMRYFLNNENQEWTESYNKQGLIFIEDFAKKGNLSKNGNAAPFNRMLDYYHKKYGLKTDEMTQIHPTIELFKLNDIMKQLDKTNGWAENKHKNRIMPYQNTGR